MLVRKVVKKFKYKNYVIPPGRLIAVIPSVFHHDKNYFEDPYTFNPDRWEDIKIKKFNYFPFGVGPNECVKLKIILAW
jgi:3-epi-6-deoxocathasterone 23-monooxygenase